MPCDDVDAVSKVLWGGRSLGVDSDDIICSGGRENHLPSSSGKIPISKKSFAFLTFSSQKLFVWLYSFNVDTFFGVNNKIAVVGSSTEKLHLNPYNNNIIMKLLNHMQSKSYLIVICMLPFQLIPSIW